MISLCHPHCQHFNVPELNSIQDFENVTKCFVEIFGLRTLLRLLSNGSDTFSGPSREKEDGLMSTSTSHCSITTIADLHLARQVQDSDLIGQQPLAL